MNVFLKTTNKTKWTHQYSSFLCLGRLFNSVSLHLCHYKLSVWLRSSPASLQTVSTVIILFAEFAFLFHSGVSVAVAFPSE